MFTSVIFILFLTIVWLMYLCVPKSLREALLLLVGYIFVAYISLMALVVLVASTFIVYIGGIQIEKHKKAGANAKMEAVSYILIFALILIVVKNIPTGINLLGGLGLGEDHVLRNILLPVGFSFYSFQAIGYLYDVYQGKEEAEHVLIRFALYMNFFPKFVSGPIEKKGAFCGQIEKIKEIKVLDKDRISLALIYMLWGYFLKMVVADRLALTVDTLHLNPGAYDTVWLLLGAVFYSFQVYTDFAGYTCIAIGVAKLFGMELMANFDSPYMSKNITEFWRRWHISLSSWLKEYIYIPLGGNRKGNFRKYVNTMIVFVLCGIWHGNGIQFLVWGIIHGIYSALDGVVLKRIKNNAIACAMTFLAVSFAWIFFRADSLMQAWNYIKCMVVNGIHPLMHIPYFTSNGPALIQVALGIVLVVIVWIMDGICYKRGNTFPELILAVKPVYKWLFVYVAIMMIFVFGIYGGNFDADKFIYMQF